MPLVLPNPNVPTNGQPLDATPVLANITAIAQAIQAFDGSQITAGSVVAAAMNANINPNTLLNENTFPFVVGNTLVWSVVSGLNVGMTSGVLYYNGIRVPVTSIASQAMAANKDTYIDIDVNGNVTYQAVTNNAASPALTANSIRVAIIVSGAASITYINQGLESAVLPIISSVALSVTDSLGNLIYPRDPNRKILGLRQIVVSQTGITTAVDITGLSSPVIVPSGRKVRVSLVGQGFQDVGGTATGTLTLFEDGVQIQAEIAYIAANTGQVPVSSWVVKTPTTGLHTYKAQAAIASNTGTFSASTNTPAQLIIELV